MSEESNRTCTEENCSNEAVNHFICNEHLQKSLNQKIKEENCEEKEEKFPLDIISLILAVESKKPVPYQLVKPLLAIFGTMNKLSTKINELCLEEILGTDTPNPIVVKIYKELNPEEEGPIEELTDEIEEDWDSDEPWDLNSIEVDISD